MKRNLTYLGGLAALFGLALAVSTYNVDTNEAFAVAGDSDTMSIGIACTEATQTAFVPDLTYTATITAAAVGTNPSDTTQTVLLTTLGNAVNGQVVGDISDETVVSDGSANATLEFWHSGPKIKTAGLACTTNTKAEMSSTAASASGNANLAVSFVGPAATAYDATHRVDNAVARDFFKLVAPLIAAAPADGSDADGLQNGEIAYDGSNYRLANKFTYLGTADDAGTDDIVIKFVMN